MRAQAAGTTASELPRCSFLLCVPGKESLKDSFFTMARSPDTDSLCALMEECSVADNEKNKFQAQLAEFPHTFQLKDQERLAPVQLTRLKTGLESALSVGYETEIETARARNLLAYALHGLNQPEDSLKQLDLVLKTEDGKENLVTLANKAVILWNKMHLSEADELVNSLKEMKNMKEFPCLVVRAKAELAFSYTRLGPSFFSYAIAKFEEVIPKAREPEKWLWKFGLALTKRRLLRAKPQGVSATPSPESAAEHRDLLLLLMEITQNCGSKYLKAKANSETALLLYMVSKTPLNREFIRTAQMDVVQACERALELDSNDNSVLCKCGKILRYCRQTERSCELLKKALSIRPSSTGYHHLGLTYKALACGEKYKNQVKIPGYYRQLERLHAGPRGPQNNNIARPQFRHMSAGGSHFNRGASAHSHDRVDSTAAVSNMNNVHAFSLNRDVRVMQRTIKSPTRPTTHYTRDDKFIKEALHNFNKAVKFSQGGNTRAIYDLAFLHRNLGEPEEAKKYFHEMLKQQYSLLSADQISAYEQLGLTMRELAESETDEAKKRHLLQDSSTMLQMALMSASEVYSRSPGVREHLDELCGSFSLLLQEVEKSNHNRHWKLQEKARLFQLIKDHKQSLELLQEIEQMDPEKTQDPSFLKLCIEGYVETERFEKALTFVKLLKCTTHCISTMKLFNDEQYELKIYMRAAHQALFSKDPSFAKLRFRHAFVEAMNASQNVESSSECEDTDSSEDSRSEAEAWDVAILNEETKEAWTKATALSSLLKDVCGLKVAVTDRDAPPNRWDFEGELRILRKSSMVLVLAGGKPSRRIRYFLRHIAKKTSTVALLMDGDHVPQLLKANRSKTCSLDQLQRCKTADGEKMTDTEADIICDVFGFLVNVEINMPEARCCSVSSD